MEEKDISQASVENEVAISKRKKSIAEKARETFVMEDILVVWENTKSNVIMPGIRNIVASTLHTIVDGIFRGNTSGSYSYDQPRKSGGDRLISYEEYYRNKNKNTLSIPAAERDSFNNRENVRKDISEYDFESERDVLSTIEWMDRTLRRNPNGYLTIAEWYSHFHVKALWTDVDWGWRSVEGMKPMPRMNGKWYLSVPTPEEIR